MFVTTFTMIIVKVDCTRCKILKTSFVFRTFVTTFTPKYHKFYKNATTQHADNHQACNYEEGHEAIHMLQL